MDLCVSVGFPISEMRPNMERALLKDDAIRRTFSAILHLDGKVQIDSLKRARILVLFDNTQMGATDDHAHAQILTRTA